MLKLKVLIIDPEVREQNDIFHKLHQTHADVHCDLVDTAEQGIKKVLEHNFDVVFVKLKLSGINGYDCCKRIKRFSPRTKVVLLTDIVESFGLAKAKEAGADQFCRTQTRMPDLLSSLGFVLQPLVN